MYIYIFIYTYVYIYIYIYICIYIYNIYVYIYQIKYVLIPLLSKVLNAVNKAIYIYFEFFNQNNNNWLRLDWN